MSRAHEILTKLRDIYVERITQLLEENESDYLSHARGEGYSNMDELMVAGEELRQISVILGCVPEPKPTPAEVTESIPQVSWALWADQMRAGNLAGATASLSSLIDIDFILASRCVSHFSRVLARDPQAFAKIQRIRQAGLLGERCRLLAECFGLAPLEAISVANHF